MKSIFLAGVLLLTAAGALTWLTAPDTRTEVPVLYWSTDPNPARIEQIDLFHQWLVDNGYVTPEGEPILELRLETAQTGLSKVIHGVSGVAADIMDCDVSWFTSLGLLDDVTDDAVRLGFGVDQTYAAVEPFLTRNGRQYGYPCNVGAMGLWVNLDTFERIGMPPPPRSWDVATFERVGLEFVRRANPEGQRQTRFFVNTPDFPFPFLVRSLHRSLGLSDFNETMTACSLEDERYVRTLELIHKWTFQDHILPSAAEEASFAAQAGYGGGSLSLFNNGNYGMVIIGRWCLIRMREFTPPPRLEVSYFPYFEFENVLVSSRTAGVYKGGKHKDLARLFLGYLASDAYNAHIVRDADALPPKPSATETEAYRHPADHPNEWGAHEATAVGAKELGIAFSVSPFVSQFTSDRIKKQMRERFMTGMASALESARDTAARVNAEITLTLNESPALRREYDQLMVQQQQIDQYRHAGRPIPRDWIRNPYHRSYYAHMGWLEEKEI